MASIIGLIIFGVLLILRGLGLSPITLGINGLSIIVTALSNGFEGIKEGVRRCIRLLGL